METTTIAVPKESYALFFKSIGHNRKWKERESIKL